jgi:hypothetical protein
MAVIAATHAIIEGLFGDAFSTRSVPGCYKQDESALSVQSENYSNSSVVKSRNFLEIVQW